MNKLSDRPKIVFVDLHGNEIFPKKYQEPDMTGIATKQGINGQLNIKPVALTNKEQRKRYEDAMLNAGNAMF